MTSFSLSVLVILAVHETWKKWESPQHNLQHTEERTAAGVETRRLSQAHIYTINFWGTVIRWKCFGSAEIAPVGQIKTIKLSWKNLHWWKVFCKCNPIFQIASVGIFSVNECFIWHKKLGQMSIYATKETNSAFPLSNTWVTQKAVLRTNIFSWQKYLKDIQDLTVNINFFLYGTATLAYHST